MPQQPNLIGLYILVVKAVWGGGLNTGLDGDRSGWNNKLGQDAASSTYVSNEGVVRWSRASDVISIGASGLEYFSGESRIGSNLTIYHPQASGRVFNGNQYVTTIPLKNVGKFIGAGANVVSTSVSILDITNGSASPVTYVDATVGLLGVLNSAGGYFTGAQIPIVGEFVAFYGLVRTTWDVCFYLGDNYEPSKWYGMDDTKWFK